MDEDSGALWLIEPVADPADSCWQDRKIWKTVIVRAASPAFARLAAEDWALAGKQPHIGNESPSPVAGFSDVKLYAVRPLPSEMTRTLEDQGSASGVLAAEPF